MANVQYSSLASSQYSRISDLGKSPSVETIGKQQQGSHQNKENIIPTPHYLSAARSKNTPLADISSAIANHQSTTHQPSTHISDSSTTLLPMPRAKINQLQVNLTNKFSSVDAYPTDINHPGDSIIIPSRSDSIKIAKRKQTMLL
jgi:hypothetical protein